MGKWLIRWAVLLMSLGLATSALAQDDDRPEMRAKVFEDDEHGVKVSLPDGWTAAGSKQKGAIAVFHAAGERESRIDVLVSPITQKGEDRAETATSYFTTFHSNLLKTGFKKKEVRKEATYDGKKGLETEYESLTRKRKFRLIVWQFHHDDLAIMVTGFFPTERRDLHYESFQKVIESLALD